ncbi:hypothetical protein [Streptomyces sp. NBC_01363]|uniref:hypothetical protein n=1 Tax=Streptomyces sp. NBC_01363 TaxID=2903840 RepID=UPI0022568E80|nr:hypothetical protein [Streptomyces sp. NBC_01363]MCX4736244.1 hypothetical protein [Streptomyces sp. NBC_01363]
MSATPTVNGQIIGRAHYATRAVLERLLAATGTTFHQSLALNAVAGNGGAIERGRLVDRMTAALKTDAAVVEATLAELTAAELLAEVDGTVPRIGLTAAGRDRLQANGADVADLTTRLYADLPAEDLEAAGRVLIEVTARANAVLAGA